MKIILSIKPEFVNEILIGRKRYEYRKSIFTKDVESVIIYSTMPIGRIVGEFSIAKIETGSPEAIWDKTQQYAGISKSFFDNYFKNKSLGYAMKIRDLKVYEEPINPVEVMPSFVPPQSFRYVTDEEFLSWQINL